MNTRWLKSVLLVLICTGSLTAQNRQNLLDTVRNAPTWKEWSTSRESVNYDQSQVDALGPDVSADLELYGVKGVTIQEWRSAQGKVRATLFEMLDSPAAYGFFNSQRPVAATPTPVLIGGDSFRTGGALTFWQSNYVVKLDGQARAVNSLAQLLSEKILGRSRKPTVSQHLPPAQLVPGSEKYLLNADAIDGITGMDAERLGFDASAEAATASYEVNGVTAKLLLMLYPTHHLAKKYATEIDATATTPAEFRKRDGALLAIVYDTADGSVAKSILDGVNLEYNITYNESNEVASYAKMILAIFKLIGLGLLLSVIAGIAFGGLRLLVKAWFPNKVFDRAQDIEIIQLKLDQSLTRKEITD